jgi:hypothetical protein
LEEGKKSTHQTSSARHTKQKSNKNSRDAPIKPENHIGSLHPKLNILHQNQNSDHEEPSLPPQSQSKATAAISTKKHIPSTGADVLFQRSAAHTKGPH